MRITFPVVSLLLLFLRPSYGEELRTIWRRVVDAKGSPGLAFGVAW